jgi:hypothetical protein
MGSSKSPLSVGRDVPWLWGLAPSRTPGSLGRFDQGDPSSWSLIGDTPGSLGVNDHAAPLLCQAVNDLSATQRKVSAPAGKVGDPGKTGAAAAGEAAELLKAQERTELVLLAAVAYGEASNKDVYEEMAAIANVILRQKNARGTTLDVLLGPKSTYAYAASDGNARTKAFRKASPSERVKNSGMAAAIKAAKNALDDVHDYSDEAYFWDGADLKSNYANHPKVKAGIKFTKPEHNIYGVKESSVNVTTHWMVKDKHGKLVQGKVRGTYTHTYESTAAYGGTVFWKYTDEFLKATGNAAFK